MLQYLFQSFFIAAEKPKLGLFFTVAAGATNMVLDFVLVGVAGFGLAGAASATVISQMVGGVAPIFYLRSAVPAAACISQSRCSACGSCSKPAPTASAS